MFRGKLTSKVTALFVVAFICLNAGGVVCVAYCQSFDISAKTEHCPLQKPSEHCNRSEKRANDPGTKVTPTEEADCCPFTVSFVSAPVETSSVSLDTSITGPVQELKLSPVFVVSQTQININIAYRGPPLDRRIDRLKHCIIRI